MNVKSSVVMFMCGIRVFRIFKTNPYQIVIRPYHSQIINNPYNIREIRIMWQVCMRECICKRAHVHTCVCVCGYERAYEYACVYL